MATIIAATDYTEIATNAVYYTCDMAKDLNRQVVVLHAYTIPVAFHENPMPVISLEESKSLAESQMVALVDDLMEKYPGLSITGNVIYGDVTDNLKEYIAKYNAWMEVVGNSSADDSGFWLGSNLMSTLRHLQCPVLAVPADYKYQKVEKIAFACDMNNISEHLPADKLAALVVRLGSELHVLNVDNENRHFDPEKPYEYARLEEMLHSVNPKYHHIEHEDVDKGIQLFVEANDMDWLVVVPHRHNFFESLFHKSHTKAIVRQAHIPLLALHEKN
ncbi:MAG: universal stress protein [Taibaiella sp.]|nr:universal stress protein [Taibaiella sp.]